MRTLQDDHLHALIRCRLLLNESTNFISNMGMLPLSIGIAEAVNIWTGGQYTDSGAAYCWWESSTVS